MLTSTATITLVVVLKYLVFILRAVMEKGELRYPVEGTPQGGVISPLLANIFLHYVLDLWALRWRQREATGDLIIVRYADDFIVGFQHETDAGPCGPPTREAATACATAPGCCAAKRPLRS